MSRAAEASPILWQNAIAAMSCLNCEAAIKEETWPGDKASHACGNTAWKISKERKSTTRPQREVITLPSLVISVIQLDEAERMHSGKRDNSLYIKAGQRSWANNCWLSKMTKLNIKCESNCFVTGVLLSSFNWNLPLSINLTQQKLVYCCSKYTVTYLPEGITFLF